MSHIRSAAVAGSFYPLNPQILKQAVNQYLKNAKSEKITGRAFIVPHAGYIYSAPIAANVYKTIYESKNKYKRIVLLGPAHRVAFQGLAVPKVEFFSTPLGNVLVDNETRNKALPLPFVVESDVPHEQEHCLEVQLPFLQEVLPHLPVLPVVVGDVEPDEVMEFLDETAASEDTLILISSDLSHYHSDSEAKKMDSQTARDIENFNFKNLSGDKACGYLPIQGLLKFALSKHWKSKILDLRNSGDTAGDKNRVVGYGAFAFYE